MQLLCHRGYWDERSEQNSLGALERAVRCGYGIETDIRDCDGELVVSHDIPRSSDVLTFESFLAAYIAIGKGGMLALNVKSDGLQEKMRAILSRFGITEYFVFDMSVPDTLGYIACAMPIAVRFSEYESDTKLLAYADFIWLDSFRGDWYSKDYVIELLVSGKHVCVVSPDLHKRPHRALWDDLAMIPTPLSQRLFLCTDFFAEALEVFNVEQN